MQKQLNWNIKNTLVVFIVLFIINFLLITISLIFPDFTSYWDNKINDQLYVLKLKFNINKKIDPFIVHVDLNDTSVIKHNISINDRKVFADAIDTFSNIPGTRVLVDVNFPERFDKIIDTALVNSVKKHKKIFIPVIPLPVEYLQVSKDINPDDENSNIYSRLWYPKVMKKGNPYISQNIFSNFKELQEEINDLAHITAEPDEDNIYRRIPLLIKYKEGYVPFLSLALIADYLNITDKDIEIYFGDKIVLKNIKGKISNKKEIAIPIDDKGRVIVNYAGKWNDTFPHYSIESFIGTDEKRNEMAQKLSEELRDCIIILSDITTRSKDYGGIPIETIYPLSGVHSNFINSVLENDFIYTYNRFEKIIIFFILFILLSFIGSKLKMAYYIIISVFLFILYNFSLFLSFVCFIKLTVAVTCFAVIDVSSEIFLMISASEICKLSINSCVISIFPPNFKTNKFLYNI